ncbi:MAG: hypothetical protein ACTSYF_12125 [Promethearchaeota archaeon]
MTNIKRQISVLVFISIFFIFSISFLPRESVAEEWTYEGVDTLRIPEFSVYPSECYSWIYLEGSMMYGNFMMLEITKANLTDSYSYIVNFPMGENGTSIWAEQWLGNVSTGEKQKLYSDVQLVYWNKSVGYRAANTILIPLEENGTISEETFDNATENWEITFFSVLGFNFEHLTTDINSLSCKYWNDTYNQAYFKANYTEDGVLKDMEIHKVSYMLNLTLLSKPAQLTPDFEIITENGELIFENKSVIVNVTINDADNNNDEVIDDDYLYRIFIDNQWTDWAIPINQINWTLSGTETGNYTISIEIRNMYGITQEEITIEYAPLVPDLPSIPGYSIITVIFGFTLGILILLVRNRRNFT